MTSGPFVMLGIAVVAWYYFKSKKSAPSDSSATPTSDTSSSGAGAGQSAQDIINKNGRLFLSGKTDEIIARVSENLDRFSGHDKASLLNQRGGAYFMKADYQSAQTDYKQAYELDGSLNNLTSYVEALDKCNMDSEAKTYAATALQNPNIDNSDRKKMQAILDK